MEKKQKRYSVDFKYKVVQAYLESGKTQPEICKEYGISRSSLIKWTKQLKENGLDALQNKMVISLSEQHRYKCEQHQFTE